MYIYCSGRLNRNERTFKKLTKVSPARLKLWAILFYIMCKNKNKKHRYYVYLKSNFSCVYCGLKFIPPYGWDRKTAIHNGEMFLEIDHIKPLSKGGSDELDNKQSLCQKCNNKKSNNYGETN